VAADRDAILQACDGTGFFNPAELQIAAEVLDDAIARGAASDYHSRTALVRGQVAGWVCFGHTACTAATWDIYWIAVDPRCQGQGVGAALMRQAEAEIRRKGGKLAVLDTSGRPQYVPTRGFYLKQGFQLAAELPDFYSPGDAKVVFTKVLA
jgi:ribosomal protein S18 acetylase RimI-like enzyme